MVMASPTRNRMDTSIGHWNERATQFISRQFNDRGFANLLAKLKSTRAEPWCSYVCTWNVRSLSNTEVIDIAQQPAWYGIHTALNPNSNCVNPVIAIDPCNCHTIFYRFGTSRDRWVSMLG